MARTEAQSGAAGKYAVALEDFRKHEDGSWTSIRNSDVTTPDGAIRIPRGMDFRRGTSLCGVDIALLLDEELAARGAKSGAA